MDTKKATLCVLGAGVLWGCISLFANIMTAAGMTSFQISGVRMIVSTVGMALVVFLTDRSKFRIRIRDIWMFIGTGFVSLTLFNICYFACMQMSEVSVAVVLLYTSPVWVMLMSAVVFRERITPKKLAALVMTFAGCALVAGIVGGAVQLTPIALVVGVAGGVFYALYSIFGNVALKSYDTMTVTFWTFAIGAVASLFISDHAGTVAIAVSQPSLWLVFLGIGVLCTIVPFLLYTLGLKHMEAGRAAILATAEPLVGSLLGIFAYGESAGPVKIIGMFLILASVILLNVGDKKPAE
jgi:drug/metabolite transporter, DME family